MFNWLLNLVSGGSDTVWQCPKCKFWQVSWTIYVNPNANREHNPKMNCGNCNQTSKLSECKFRGFPDRIVENCVYCGSVVRDYQPPVKRTQSDLEHYYYNGYTEFSAEDPWCPKCKVRT